MFDYSTTKYMRWTPTAVECYLRGCNCKGCFIKNYFDKVTTYKYRPRCHMKSAVIALVRNIGKPTKEDYRNLRNIKNATNTTIQ